jgi:hypothetical protein
LLSEEVDLCKRIQAKGNNICYWPDVVVVHLGGESSKSMKDLKISSTGKQITLWQMRSALLFYRKHYGALSAWLWMQMENLWLMLRALKNGWSKQADKQQKAAYSKTMRRLLRQAWHDTKVDEFHPPARGDFFSVISYQLSVISYQFSVFSDQLSAISDQFSVSCDNSILCKMTLKVISRTYALRQLTN